jgi:hypothetical protein
MIFSAVDWASTSEARSCGVTMLSTVPVWGDETERRMGVIAARHCPGLRSYVTIENFEMSAMQRPRARSATMSMASQETASARGWGAPGPFPSARPSRRKSMIPGKSGNRKSWLIRCLLKYPWNILAFSPALHPPGFACPTQTRPWLAPIGRHMAARRFTLAGLSFR